MRSGSGRSAAGARSDEADPGSPERAATEYLRDSAAVLSGLAEGRTPDLAVSAARVVAEALAGGGKVLFCGNGGSAADAQHLAAELVGRLDRGRDRGPLRGVALTTDTSVLTAVANDYGYEEVFARQVLASGRPGDVLVAITTSGTSSNVVRAAEAARRSRLRVIALVGEAASPLDDLADVALHVPGATSGQVQQGHITLGHLVCTLAEDLLRAR